MTILHVKKLYDENKLTPREMVRNIRETLQKHADNPIWIHVLSDEELEPYLARLEKSDKASLPLYGIPFAIKDNIDLARIPTTAGCEAYRYIPKTSAYVVQCLLDAGAIPIGKTNLDQFATGLVGTRSPYGACCNSINTQYISGGSSSGSAVSVALDMVSFSLGTDTAGSGRVPAAFNNLVGLKPSKGVLSTSGVVPACRSLDCVSIFTHTTQDATYIFNIVAHYDKNDLYSRKMPDTDNDFASDFTFAVPQKQFLQFFGDKEAEELYYQSIDVFEHMGGKKVEIDFSSFLKAANLLYFGPWVSERYIAIKELIETKPESLVEVIRTIIGSGATKSAEDYFNAEYQLKACKRVTENILHDVDFVLTPTTGTIYTIDEVNANPIALNTNLGYYTNFMNLLDFSALALPGGFRTNGLPFGITIFSEAFNDRALLTIGQHYMQRIQHDTNN